MGWFFSVIGSIIAGALLGLIAGFYGKWADMLISRLFDILLAFPAILLAIAIVAILGPSLQNALLAIAIVNIPTYGRLVRSRVLSLRQEEFITSARTLGAGNARILFRHIYRTVLHRLLCRARSALARRSLRLLPLDF